MNNYTKLLERISRSANVKIEELESKIEAKRAKLSGLISREGAAQIVAAELGVVFENERLKISEILQGMKKVNTLGKIIRIFPVKEFNKNGREGKVASFIFGDETSNTRVVLWDTNQISLIENGELSEGDVIEISNASMRNGDIHLSSFSNIKKSSEKMDEVKTEKVFSNMALKDLKPGLSVINRSTIMQIFEPRYFNDKKSGDKRAVLNILLDDGTDTTRAVIFGDNITKIGFNEGEIFSVEMFEKRKQDFIGEEMIFKGSTRINQFFNRVEFSIDDVEKPDVESLIKELEEKLAS